MKCGTTVNSRGAVAGEKTWHFCYWSGALMRVSALAIGWD